MLASDSSTPTKYIPTPTSTISSTDSTDQELTMTENHLGLSTGITQLDQVIDGIYPGQIIEFAGPSSSGKSQVKLTNPDTTSNHPYNQHKPQRVHNIYRFRRKLHPQTIQRIIPKFRYTIQS
jgi:replicative DNA helicase